MICPYCQHELEVESLSCPRCFAEYPRASRPFGFGLRLTVAATAMMMVSTLILVQCVVAYLPGGKYAVIPDNSMIFSGGTATNRKSPEVEKMLARWAAHQQNAEQPIPTFVGNR
jgi:hypothetical protein